MKVPYAKQTTLSSPVFSLRVSSDESTLCRLGLSPFMQISFFICHGKNVWAKGHQVSGFLYLSSA